VKYIRLDLSIKNDPRFIVFSHSFNEIEGAYGAWLNAIIFACNDYHKKIPLSVWEHNKLSPALVSSGLFAKNDEFYFLVKPTYCAIEGMDRGAIRMTPDDLLNLWNEHCGTLPKAKEMLGSRRAKASLRLKESDDANEWRAVIQWLAKSEWHTGKNARSWTADINFLLKPDTRVKVSERIAGSKNSATKSFEEW
jgi:hypothetical protein